MGHEQHKHKHKQDDHSCDNNSCGCCHEKVNTESRFGEFVEKIEGFCENKIVIAVCGAFLIAAFLLIEIFDVDIPLHLNPAWIPTVICGLPILIGAVVGLLNKKITSALLMTVAIVACISIGELFAAGEVAFIMAIGEILEDITVGRAKKGLKKLVSLVPETARVIDETGEHILPIEQIGEGTIVRILPGERVPVDGTVRSGFSSVDQSIVTGESLPVDVTVGDSVYCGTIVGSYKNSAESASGGLGAIEIEATHVGEDSSLQKLIRIVEESESKKAPMQKIADKWAAFLVPAALLTAAIVGIICGIITRDASDAGNRAVTMIVVFCPCALVLATPVSIMAAIGQATKYGVIIKSGEALERMSKIDTVAFDKTGTLTKGKLTLCDIVTASGFTERETLASIITAEQYSTHPLARAAVEYISSHGIAVEKSSDFIMIPGRGVSVRSDKGMILCGNEAMMNDANIDVSEIKSELETLRGQGKAVIIAARGGRILGLVALSDTLREQSKMAVGKLAELGVDTVLLSGDHGAAAKEIAARCGIAPENVFAELLPGGKVEQIELLNKKGHKVCMVGDGVNDAPALSAAHVGVAMAGAGSDIAEQSADIALTGDDITRLPYLVRLSKKTTATIRFNIALSVAINIAAVVLAALNLLNPVWGALIHNVGSVLVTLNAALLYNRRK